jgi:hypothetical protein
LFGLFRSNKSCLKTTKPVLPRSTGSGIFCISGTGAGLTGLLSAKAIVANATAKGIARMTFFIRRLRLESSVGTTPMKRILTGLKNGAPEKCEAIGSVQLCNVMSLP